MERSTRPLVFFPLLLRPRRFQDDIGVDKPVERPDDDPAMKCSRDAAGPPAASDTLQSPPSSPPDNASARHHTRAYIATGVEAFLLSFSLSGLAVVCYPCFLLSMPTIGEGPTLLLSKASRFEEAQRVWMLDCWIVLRCKSTVVDAHGLTVGSDL